MIRSSKRIPNDQQLAAVLVESDRRYFELAAQTESLSIGKLCWMPGLNELAASCVVHRVAPGQAITNCELWLDEVETNLQLRSISRARVYFDEHRRELADSFLSRGYEQRSEIGFLAPPGHPQPPPAIALVPIQSDDDWLCKFAIHQRTMEGPDGYVNQADLWVEMERRKCATERMRPFLVVRGRDVVATVGTIVDDGLLRLKNIVVDPRYRRQGVALATVQHLWKMAEVDHHCRLGVFGVQGDKGTWLYQRAGLYAVVEQIEWSKILRSDE